MLWTSILLQLVLPAMGFLSQPPQACRRSTGLLMSLPNRHDAPHPDNHNHNHNDATLSTQQQPGRIQQSHDGVTKNRRQMVWMVPAAAAASLLGLAPSTLAADEPSSSFAEIAARANQITQELDQQALSQAATIRETTQTAYDFTLPVNGEAVKFADLIHQEFYSDGNVRVKAIVVVNFKQDDPVARKTIPELMAVAAKYSSGNTNNNKNKDAPTSAVAVVVSPTDQGYYEPDTSALIRLKLASEYGYGINPATVVTDKVNLLGTGAHPFWRWLQSTSRIPTSGVGRIQGNFEKWILDGRTGLPLRRYPRRYQPLDMEADVQAVVQTQGQTLTPNQLPPAKANYLESWRAAVLEAERDTYRFEKGLNVFDQ